MNDCGKKPKPNRILFRILSGLLFICCVYPELFCIFFNISGRFAADSYIRINVVLGMYKNNC